MQQYMNIARAFREGNIGLFHRTVDEYEEYFVQKATYILIERSRVYVYRTFIKKYYQLMLAVDTKASAAAGAVVLEKNKVDLNQLLVAFRLHGLDWVSCIHYTILYQFHIVYADYILVYVSMKHCMSISSKQQLFGAIILTMMLKVCSHNI
jgi:hypothetical protein